ncbi:hypothetical protein [Nocardioides sp. 616]|uniref:hypothetical protein n=1 Tax=Nocardioides sp. 616 TaxID=2268090 RepID=UPI0013B42395|nr:hypothetical protein [Nocardioides sp. 616]
MIIAGATLIFVLVLGILAVAFKRRPQRAGWVQRAVLESPPGSPPPDYRPWSAETPYVGSGTPW